MTCSRRHSPPGGSTPPPRRGPPPPGGGHAQDCGDCGVHGGMHGCVFILSMLGLAIGLVLLFRLAFQPLDGHGTPGRHRPARRERPPPWTMPTLSELSILRI
ncbi:hypothetical protein [Nocardia cyriacigeorgica]|uniref:hypothetical protein n=1 Tax=Nocardia cyriacigeorgica TaxID=135487 RepID=UPI0024540E1B|nr:hypothetical protein [Nocardia cyriacigeorgica]